MRELDYKENYFLILGFKFGLRFFRILKLLHIYIWFQVNVLLLYRSQGFIQTVLLMSTFEDWVFEYYILWKTFTKSS